MTTPQSHNIDATVLTTLLKLSGDSERNSANLASLIARFQKQEQDLLDLNQKIDALTEFQTEQTGFHKASKYFAGVVGGVIVLLITWVKDWVMMHPN